VTAVKKIDACIKPFKLEEVRQALTGAGVDALMVSEVRSGRREEWRTDSYRGVAYTLDLLPKIRLEVVVPDCRAEQVISLITRAARNGPREAGTIWVSSVEDAIRIRTGERGEAAVW
jgi:nitrogen regulatory protein P-II 1